MARTLITTSELIVAENHPNYPDVKNRYGKELWTSIIAEHTTDGGHNAPYRLWPIPSVGTYQGTGAALPVTFTVTTYTEILMLVIWSEEDGNLYMGTGESVPEVKSNVAESPETDRVTALTTTGFTLGTAAETNTDTVDYYYFVVGIGTTPDAGSNASPPTWIGHDVAMLGGNSSQVANSVEAALDTVFQVEHTEAGAHLTAPFAGLAKAEQGTFTPQAEANKIITLDDATLDIKHLLLFADSEQLAGFTTEGMPTFRAFATAALPSTGYVTLGTGQFSVNASILGTEETFFNLQSDTTDGSQVFTDSSSYAWTIGRQGAVAHSTTKQQTGASSIKFPVFPDFSQLMVSMPDLKLFRNFDISFYINMESLSTSASWEGLLLAWAGFGDFIIQVRVSSAGTTATIKYYVTSTTGAPYHTVSGTTEIDDGSWHKVRILAVNGNWTFYVDTTVQGTANVTEITSPVDMSFLTIYGAQVTYQSAAVYLDNFVFKRTAEFFTAGREHYFVVTGV